MSNTTSSGPQVQVRRGVVKQVLSGDTIVIRDDPKGKRPPEMTINFCNVIAPKLERRKANESAADESKDQPWAWESREFLRTKLIGQDVYVIIERSLNDSKAYGVVYLGKDKTGENMIESSISEGLVKLKNDPHANSPPEIVQLHQLQLAAANARKGLWSENSSDSGYQNHVRNVKWSVEEPRKLVEKFGKKPIKAIIEHVRDGSTVRAILLPDFYYITLMISGIRCPGWSAGRQETNEGEPFADEALYFVESRLLNREVEIVLETASNNNFVGSILHPRGNIAESLLSGGFARCQDWSINNCISGAEKLYRAERAAKEARKRIWKDYKPSGPQIELAGTVSEIVNADALIIKLLTGETKKVFLSSIKPPGRDRKPGEESTLRPKDFKPLYDIPWMLEAREFLREKLIGKAVKVFVDYIQPAKDKYPEKMCCTVTLGKTNIAEALVSKGLAKVVKYRQNDDQRSSHYDMLQIAETKAEKSGHGLHAKKDIPVHRLVDLSNDPPKAKAFLTSLKRSQGIKAVVEFITSGSRLKLFLPKDDQLITFLLAGIRVPRVARQLPSGKTAKADPYSEEALKFTRERCFQRDVEIKIENTEVRGSGFIGWLSVNGVNMSVALVEEGLAEVIPFPDSGELTRILKTAEERAKAQKLNMWSNYVEVEREDANTGEEQGVSERKINYEKVVVSEIADDLCFYAQHVEQRDALESMLLQLRQELSTNPPLPGAYKPTRGSLAVAKFTADDQWYRVKVEKISGPNVGVLYIDYGNRETVNVTRVADLPARFATRKPYAREYVLGCVKPPKDTDDKKAAIEAFREDVLDKILLLNEEYKENQFVAVTLVESTTNEDVAKGLIADGLVQVQKLRDKRLSKLLEEYKKVETEARERRMSIWRYGNIEDEDDELVSKFNS